MSSLRLELPHTSSGETDWNTLGNMLSAKILGEVLHASYVDRTYGKGSRDFTPDTEWKFMYKEDDVVALQKAFVGSPIKAFMGRGVIDRPMDDIVHFLECHERRKEWDKYLKDIKQVKAMSEKDFILYMQVETARCLVKYNGDFVQYERMAYTSDDKYVRTVMSVELPDIPCKRNIIRGELHPGTGWVLEPYNGSRSSTLVSFLAHVDLKGLPPLIVNRIMRRQPKAIHRIRKILMREARAEAFTCSLEESSVDSFTPSEKRAVLAATLDYNHTHFDCGRYEEGVSIEDFTGRREERPRRFLSIPPVLRYNRDTDSFTDRSGVRRSASISNSTPSTTAKESSDHHTSKCNGDANQRSTVAPVALNSSKLLSAFGPHSVSSEEELGMLEVPIHSDPVIVERTGFEGDTESPFFTPSGSLPDVTES